MNSIADQNDDTNHNSVPPKCTYFVARKRRYCKMDASSGKRFCGQHLVNDDQTDSASPKRIPCPLDPNHSCFENKLSQHLKCCNARQKEGIPYFSKGLNEGEEEVFTEVQFRSLSDSDLLEIIQKVQHVHKDHIGEIEERIGEHAVLREELSNEGYGYSVTRHLKQNSSLLSYLETQNILKVNTPSVFIEFGAGRGKLTKWLIEAVKEKENASFLLVDKGAQRYKMDAKLKHDKTMKIKRIRIDIQDLNLSAVDEIQDNSLLVAYGKHLCGAATDFSLRCLMRSKRGTVGGITIALCCHHRCTWKSYAGKEFLKSVGFSGKEFGLLVSLSSWAVSGSRHSTEDQSKEKDLDPQGEEVHGLVDQIPKEAGENRYSRLGLSVASRKDIGRKAKQIIDLGRVMYLRSFDSLDANLIQYVDQSCTLENIAIVAVPKQSP